MSNKGMVINLHIAINKTEVLQFQGTDLKEYLYNTFNSVNFNIFVYHFEKNMQMTQITIKILLFQPFYMQNFDKDVDRVSRKFAGASHAGLEVTKR